ncbi:MAG: tetratricopeptide repeat protein [Ferruginibacter sp.]
MIKPNPGFPALLLHRTFVLFIFFLTAFKCNAQFSENDIDDKTFFIGKIETMADIEKLKTAVAEDNLQAMLLLAGAYLQGNLVYKDSAEAVKLLELCIKKGENSILPLDLRRSQAAIARLMFIAHSPYMKQYGAELFSWFLADAKSGNTKAMLATGFIYREGTAVKKDSAEAMNWFLKAAGKKDDAAMELVGTMYDNGSGVAKDSVLALQWYEKAAKAGNSSAMISLAIKYRKGRWVKRDYEKAFELYEKAAKAGNVYGMAELGDMYLYGKGTAQDDEAATRWYLKATEKTYPPLAMYRLGTFFESGKAGIKQNYSAALNCYKKAGNNGLFRIGNLYEFGKGAAPDMEEAKKWYQKAVANENITGMYWLGHWYEKKKDIDSATFWYQKALDLMTKYVIKSIDDSEGMITLATMYENGNGTTKDMQRAIDYYNAAAELGNEDAKRKLKELVQ